MDKFTKPELLNFLCEVNEGNDNIGDNNGLISGDAEDILNQNG